MISSTLEVAITILDFGKNGFEGARGLCQSICSRVAVWTWNTRAVFGIYISKETLIKIDFVDVAIGFDSIGINAS
jgi:hypothetical protein